MSNLSPQQFGASLTQPVAYAFDDWAERGPRVSNSKQKVERRKNDRTAAAWNSVFSPAAAKARMGIQ